MADRRRGLWRYRALFIVLAALIAFIQLLPIDVGPGHLPGPDVLLLITLAWTIMRPEIVPVPLVAAVFFMADLLFMRPPGLWTALVLLGCEFLRSRRILLRNTSFVIEWLLVAGVVAAQFIANALILGIFLVPQPAPGLTVIGMLFTIGVYPLVVILAGRAFGLSKPSGERESLGARR